MAVTKQQREVLEALSQGAVLIENGQLLSCETPAGERVQIGVRRDLHGNVFIGLRRHGWIACVKWEPSLLCSGTRKTYAITNAGRAALEEEAG